MGKAKTKGKERLDKFYHLAKEQGYRSRAAFKLIQLDAKFQFLPSARSLLDLCAAPGGWMQVAVKHMPVGSFVLGVDLFPIRPIRGALSLDEDITTEKCRAAIRKRMRESGCSMFDVVLHDGSPNIGGAWAQEATTQSSLVVDAVKLATEFLAPKGIFVTKVFRSQDYSAVLYCLKQLFDKVEVTKPVASRSTSAEIYVVGLRYKAPAKIDPRLLDVKHLFQGAKEPPKVLDVLRGTKQKRNRDGYEDGSTVLRKVCSASDFIWSETPLEILGSVTSISFEDPACLSIKDHALTTEEIKALCDDLRVLAKQDFKYLLKWRMHMRKALSPTQKVASKAADADENQVNDDDRILNEMEELTFAMDRKKKRAKKRLAKRRAKDKTRKATGMQIDVMEDGYQDLELFSLSSIKGKQDLQAVDSAQFDDENGEFIEHETEDAHTDVGREDSPSDIDSDEEHRRYDEQLEEFLDAAYDRFLTREGSKKQLQKRAKLALAKDNELWEETQVGDDDLYHSGHDSDKDHRDREQNPLVVPLHEEEELTQEQITEQWFSQDIFAAAAAENETRAKDSDDEIEEKEVQNKKFDSDDEIEEKGIQNKKLLIPEKPNNISHPLEGNKTRVVDSEDFEIVPAEDTDESSSSSSDESEYDNDEKAEILAYAKKMLRKRQRDEILDDAYNKYMFDDDNSNLPAWFVEEEKKHRQPIKPVTKEDIAAMKARFREIDARPAKKVAQAKARKKRVAMRQLETVRKKANAISDQVDISEMSKTKMIDKLYKKAVPKKPKKEYVVAKKGIQVKPGKGKVVVDPRMKKDSRTHRMGKPGRDGSKNRAKNAKGRAGKKDRREKGSSKSSGKKGRKGKMDQSM